MSRLLGGVTAAGGYTATNDYASNTCTNTGSTCTTESGTTGVAAASYFQDPANPPISTWDFTSVWRTAAGAPPALRNTP